MTALDTPDEPDTPDERAERAEPDEPDAPDDAELQGEPEPPPAGDDFFSGMFTDPQPFATPPDEPVEVIGEVPWELRDDDERPPAS
ncbi:MAG: hypothetical protein ABIO06_06740 [Pseudolysinimonas sp.]